MTGPWAPDPGPKARFLLRNSIKSLEIHFPQGNTMTYTVTPKEGCWHEITGTIPQDEVRTEYAHAFKEVAKQAPVIPGFRRGKAPKEVIVARHGEEIKSHCVNHLVNEVLRVA